jgi:hypothetical protein
MQTTWHGYRPAIDFYQRQHASNSVGCCGERRGTDIARPSPVYSGSAVVPRWASARRAQSKIAARANSSLRNAAAPVSFLHFQRRPRRSFRSPQVLRLETGRASRHRSRASAGPIRGNSVYRTRRRAARAVQAGSRPAGSSSGVRGRAGRSSWLCAMARSTWRQNLDAYPQSRAAHATVISATAATGAVWGLPTWEDFSDAWSSLHVVFMCILVCSAWSVMGALLGCIVGHLSGNTSREAG